MNPAALPAVQTDVAGKARWRKTYTPEEAREEIRSKAALSEVLGMPTDLPTEGNSNGWREEIAEMYQWCEQVCRLDSTSLRRSARQQREELQKAAANLRQRAERAPGVKLVFEEAAALLDEFAVGMDSLVTHDERLRGAQSNSTPALDFLASALRSLHKPDGGPLTGGEVALACLALDLPEARGLAHSALSKRVRRVFQAPR